jgi:hypothetical protein
MKCILATIYADLKAFQSEHDFYSTDLKALNIEGLDKLNYKADCTVTNDSFKVVAIGNFDDDAKLDVWTIDDKKNLVNINDTADLIGRIAR